MKRVIFITGASRGIGAAIARRFAKEGAKVVIAAKSDEPHPKLSGTIHSVAEEVRALGGEALPIKVDVRDDAALEAAVKKTIELFGGIDIVVNNAGAISPTNTLQTTMKSFDLMMDCNVRAAFHLAQLALPHLKKSQNPHIVSLAPPLEMPPKGMALYLGYSLSKYALSLFTMGLAEEFKEISVNALWPKTLIATSAIETFFKKLLPGSREASIVADALYALTSKRCSGHLFLDEDLLKEAGETNFDRYATEPGHPLYPDLFL